MDSLSSDSPRRKSSVTLTLLQRKIEDEKVRHNLSRARMVGNAATLTLDEWLKILDNHGWKCAYCPYGSYQVLEHSLPLIAGGGTTAENCVPACQSCNIIKRSRMAIYNDVRNSFDFVPAPSVLAKTPAQSNPEGHLEARRKAIIKTQERRIQRERKRWLTEDEVRKKLTKLSQSIMIDALVLTYMEHLGWLISRGTKQGLMYQIKRDL